MTIFLKRMTFMFFFFSKMIRSQIICFFLLVSRDLLEVLRSLGSSGDFFGT